MIMNNFLFPCILMGSLEYKLKLDVIKKETFLG